MHNLTLHDVTQNSIAAHLQTTECLLAKAASKATGRPREAAVWMLPDLGLPHNIRRIHGGFFTGGLYAWEEGVPIVPIDATVNACAVSVFRLHTPFDGEQHFQERITHAIETTRERSSYIWNFAHGNHFATHGSISGSRTIADGHYLVLHSSASEYKKQDNGLYPVPGNWFMHGIKTVHDQPSGRYLRYIEGTLAERFYNIAAMVLEANHFRHQYFASLIAGEANIAEELLHHPHYGMPTPNSVAIGCQWFASPTTFLLLTGPGQPLYFIQTDQDERNTTIMDGTNYHLYPHGLGKQSDGPLRIEYGADTLTVNGSEYPLTGSLENAPGLSVRELSAGMDAALPIIVEKILKSCPGSVVGQIIPLHSYSRVSEG